MNQLHPIQQQFILHWVRWAPVGHQPHRRPDSCTALSLATAAARRRHCRNAGVARSNVSTSLKELQGWGIVKRVHVLGDKRDHFESMKEVWEMFRIVLDERKRREIDPTLAMLRECIRQAEKNNGSDSYTRQRLADLAEFFETTTAWYNQVRAWPTRALPKFVKLGARIRKLVGAGTK